MKYNNSIFVMPFFAISLLVAANACSNSNSEDAKKTKKDTVVKTAIKSDRKVAVEKAPVINLNDTLATKHLVLCIKDSAANSERISVKLGEIYGVKLAAIIKKNNLKITGPPMAWYKSQKAPFFFEAGLPVDKKPAKLPAGVTVKQIGIDSVVIAHFYGPYNLTGQAYTALQDWMKYRKKKLLLPAYEVYVDDPTGKDGKLKDPYKVQTDIVFTWK